MTRRAPGVIFGLVALDRPDATCNAPGKVIDSSHLSLGPTQTRESSRGYSTSRYSTAAMMIIMVMLMLTHADVNDNEQHRRQ